MTTRRLKKSALRVGIALAVLLVLAAIGIAWALTTASGARTALSFAYRALPGLEISDVSGSISDRLLIGRLRYRMDSRVITLEQVTLKGTLQGVRVVRGALEMQVGSALIEDLARPSNPLELKWPKLEPLPFALDPVRVSIDQLRWLNPTGGVQLAGKIALKGRVATQAITVDAFSLTGEQVNASGNLALASGPLRPTGDFKFEANINGERVVATFNGALKPDGYRVLLTTETPLIATVNLHQRVDDWISGSIDVPKQQFRGQPISAKLAIDGSVGKPRLSGRVRYAKQRIRDLSLSVSLQPKTVVIEKLHLAWAETLNALDASGALRLKDSLLTLEGNALLDPKLSAALDAWPVPTPVKFKLSGNPQTANVELSAPADFSATARWESRRLTFSAQQKDRLNLTGSLVDSNLEISVKLADFNPSDLLSEWPGRLSGEAKVRSTSLNSLNGAQLDLQALSGELKGQSFTATGELKFTERQEPDGVLDIAFGNNKVRYVGPIGAAPAVAALDLTDLSVLDPSLSGSIIGTLSKLDEAVAVDVNVLKLLSADLQLERAQLSGLVALDSARSSSLKLAASGLKVGDQALDQLSVDAVGTLTAHELKVLANRPDLIVELAASGGLDKSEADYTINTASIKTKDAKPWQLLAPARVQWRKAKRSIEQLCLGRESANACLSATLDAKSSGSASVTIKQVDLSELSKLLQATPGIELGGTLSGTASATLLAGKLATLSAQFDLPQARAKLVSEDRELVLEAVSLSATGNPERLQVTLKSRADAASAINGELLLEGLLGPQADRRAQGQLALSSNALLPWLLSSDEVRGVRGDLRATLSISGNLSAPELSGEVTLDRFALRVPAYGIVLSKTSLRAQATSVNEIALSGSGRLGDGEVQIGGSLSARPLALNLTIKGQDLSLVNTSSINLQGSPDLAVRLEDGLWNIAGSVAIPRGQILLDQFDDAQRASPDQEFVGADPNAEKVTFPLITDIDLKIGPDVKLSGAGLTGNLSGQVKLKVRPGEEAEGLGTLQVEGRYLAFGRRLDIETAKLRFANTPLANPNLDIRASRMAGRVKAGVRVRGTALAPDIRIYTDPASTQSDALSYLVVGRPLSQSRAGDQAKLSNAAQSVGSGLLAQEIGLRFGLDDVSVEDQGFDGPRLMLGKYLSPRLYVAYGISQFDSSTLFRVRYLINAKFDIEAERGKELRATVNYRLDR